MVERPARWGQEPPEAVAAGSLRNPEHGRAYAKGVPDEVFTPELYAARARQVVADLGFSALKFDLDVPTPYMQDTASGTLSRAEIKLHGRARRGGDRRRRRRGRRRLRLPLALPGRRRAAARARARGARADVARGPGAAGERAGAGAGHEVDLDADRHRRERLHAPRLPRGVRGGAIDIAAPDPQKTGGLLETRRIADYADTHYISMAPHCIASPIGTIANVHVAAAIPNFLALGVARDERAVLERPGGRVRRAGDRRRADRGAGRAGAGRDVESGPGARSTRGPASRSSTR